MRDSNKMLYIAYGERSNEGVNGHLDFLIFGKLKRYIYMRSPMYTVYRFIKQKVKAMTSFDCIAYSSTIDMEFKKDYGIRSSEFLRMHIERTLLNRDYGNK